MRNLITHSIIEGDLRYVTNIPRHLLEKDELAVVDYIAKYSADYGKPPSESVLVREILDFAPAKVEGAALGYIANEVYNNIKRRYNKQRLSEVREKDGIDAMYEPELLGSLARETTIASHETVDLATYDRMDYINLLSPIAFGLPFLTS
jgi:hypothetical protein